MQNKGYKEQEKPLLLERKMTMTAWRGAYGTSQLWNDDKGRAIRLVAKGMRGEISMTQTDITATSSREWAHDAGDAQSR